MAKKRSDKQDRYQYQPWYIKLWRRRLMLRIPYDALVWRIRHPDFVDHSFAIAWSIATGLAHGDMNWVYDWEEIKIRLNKKHGDIDTEVDIKDLNKQLDKDLN